MRTHIEILQDKLLLLYLICSAKRYGDIEGNLKLQKLVFLSEWELMSESLGALHFKYFKYHYGPFSKELLCDNQDLQAGGYLNRQFSLSDKALDLLDYIIEPIKQHGNNHRIFDKIDATNAVYSKITGLRLTNKVYNMEIIPHDLPEKKIKIRDIPVFVDILVPENFESRYNLEVPALIMDDVKEEFLERELTAEEKKRTINDSTNRLIMFLSEAKTNI